MQQAPAAEELHPKEDGFSKNRSFFKLLAEAIETASGGKRRAGLIAVQNELLKRKWHP